MIEYFKRGEIFPPIEHAERIKRYKINAKLYRGQHKELAKHYPGFYITANLAGLIIRKSADYLVGDGFTADAQKSEQSREQKALERIHEENDLNTLLYELAIEAAHKGDAFLKVKYGQSLKGLYPASIDPFRVRIESVPALEVFPQTLDDDDKKIACIHHARIVHLDNDERMDTGRAYELRVETHLPGSVIYRVFEFIPTVYEYDKNYKPIIESGKIGDQIGKTKIQRTGIEQSLIQHIANSASPDSWMGVDDLTELHSLFSELNNRLTQISAILDKHADPALLVPAGLLEEDGSGRPSFRVATSKVIEMEKDDFEAKYLTWNGQLQNAYSEISKIEEYILMIAEVPKVAIGLDDAGTSGASGKAVRMRLNNLLTKIKRKRVYMERALKKALITGQQLEHALGIADYETTIPKLTFTDGLPDDRQENVTIALQENGGLPLKSQLRTIMEVQGLNEEQAQAEIDRIRQEQQYDIKTIQYADPNLFNQMEIVGKVSSSEEVNIAKTLGFDVEEEY